MLHNFKRNENNRIVATSYPTLLGKLFGYKPKQYIFTSKGAYKPFTGANVYYDQFGNEWDDLRITTFSNTGINFPHK